MLQNVFSGGYTHANRMYSGKVINAKARDTVIQHYDFASSYPTVICCEKYPFTPWSYTGWKEIPPIETFNDFAYIMEITFNNIRSTAFNTYIQCSKISYTGDIQLDNGRVIKCTGALTMYVTEQDYITITNNYEWDSIIVNRVYKSTKEYLPRDFILYVLELYGNKTTLKDVEGKEDLYIQSKQYINSLFGMMVTALIQSDVELIGDEWITKPLSIEEVNKKLNSLRFYNPREKRYFLNYSWGIYVTAYARRNLWKCIESVDRQVLYCDTDSIFVLGDHSFKWYDDEIDNKLKCACDAMNIDFELTRPKTPKGKPKPLGRFTQEDNCIEFITLGAKRYCERREDGKLYLTVSGINKNAVAILNNDITNFKDGLNFDKDHESVTKKLSTYIDNQPVIKWKDGYVSDFKHGINLRNTGYLLEVTSEYKNLIKYEEMTVENLSEQFLNQSRGRF